jgi:hypothetical protein
MAITRQTSRKPAVVQSKSQTTRKPVKTVPCKQPVKQLRVRLGPVPSQPKPFKCPPFDPKDFKTKYAGIHAAFPASFWSAEWFNLVSAQHAVMKRYHAAKEHAQTMIMDQNLNPDTVTQLFDDANKLKDEMDPDFREHRHRFNRYLSYCERYATKMAVAQRKRR